jgi:hypothetical protein
MATRSWRTLARKGNRVTAGKVRVEFTELSPNKQCHPSPAMIDVDRLRLWRHVGRPVLCIKSLRQRHLFNEGGDGPRKDAVSGIA